MKTALIVYGSSTGNTEFTAETIESHLSHNAYEVTLLDVKDADVSELKNAYDLYLLGCSTWGEEEIELQEDFEPFYNDMNPPIDLNGSSFAVFGCGDSSYTYFCGAVDEIEARLSALGANLVTESLRIDGEPEEDEIQGWAEDVINAA